VVDDMTFSMKITKDVRIVQCKNGSFRIENRVNGVWAGLIFDIKTLRGALEVFCENSFDACRNPDEVRELMKLLYDKEAE
jgi:hypothetical protein